MSTTAQPISDREIVSTRTIPFSREHVFEAFRDPQVIARWWGPKGFTNTFHVFEFRPDGKWSFIMHGPDGTNYQNENVFAEIEEPARIVIDHVGWPEFRLTITLADKGGKTAITWRMVFASAEDFAKVQSICVEANQQNFDRLEAALQSQS
jgi:uncharacterized protein YndB with AHSA1/START domain